MLRQNRYVRIAIRQVDQLGLIATAVLALISGLTALFSVQISLLFFGFTFMMLCASLMVSRFFTRNMKTQRADAPVSLDYVALSNNSAGGNEAYLREIHLDALEEMRMLKADIADMIEKAER